MLLGVLRLIESFGVVIDILSRYLVGELVILLRIYGSPVSLSVPECPFGFGVIVRNKLVMHPLVTILPVFSTREFGNIFWLSLLRRIFVENFIIEVSA